MTNVLVCSHCGKFTAVGILYERRSDHIDAIGLLVRPSWEKVGTLCAEHLQINGEAARINGMETKIEPLSQPGIEAKG